MRVTVSGNLGADVASVGANGATIAANAVTANGDFGVLTTPALTTAASTFEAAVTVTNDRAKTTRAIDVWVQEYSGTPITNGVPDVYVVSRADGSFVIRYGNTNATNALNAGIKVGYRIWNA